jgi:hypothetical protein
MSNLRERTPEERQRDEAGHAAPGSQLPVLRAAAQRVAAAGRAAAQQVLSGDSEGFLRATQQTSGE